VNPYQHRCGDLTGQFIHHACATCTHLLAVHTVDGTCALCEQLQVPVPVITEVLAALGGAGHVVHVVLPDGRGPRVDLATGRATMRNGELVVTYRLDKEHSGG